MDGKAQQVYIARIIGDLRSYVRDCETIMDGWNQKSKHKQKCRDLMNITSTIQNNIQSLEKLLG